MKKTAYLTLTFLLLFSFFSFSQIVPVVVTGFCTDSAGNAIASNTVLITSDTDPSGVWTLTDSNGRFTDSLAVQQGDSVVVKALDCDSIGFYVNLHLASGGIGDTIVSNFLFCNSGAVSCNGSWSAGLNGSIVYFSAQSNLSGATYSWTFGDGTTGSGQSPVHTYPGPGVYYVCLTGTSPQCTFTYCDSLQVFHTNPSYFLSGQVTKSGILDPNIDGQALLLTQDTSNPYNPWVVMDSSRLDSGYYFFQGVNAGAYHVIALLNPADPDFGSYLPTYHVNSSAWSGSTPIFLSGNTWGKDIDLQLLVGPTGGPSSIGGSVIDQGLFNPGVAMENVNVQLLDASGNVLAFDMTDNQGQFMFSNIAYGNYQVHVEIPGITHSAQVVSTSSSAANAVLLFHVYGTGVVLDIENGLKRDQFKFYPNPVNGVMNVEFSGGQGSELTYKIISSHGQLLEHSEIDDFRFGLDFTGFPSGLYYLEVIQNEKSLTFKIIRE